MIANEVAESMTKLFAKCMELRTAGGKEYAHSGRSAFENFERVAERIGMSREAVLLVYLEKHIDGIHSYVKGHRSQREHVSGRIKDAIVYLGILNAMIEEAERDTRIAQREEREAIHGEGEKT